MIQKEGVYTLGEAVKKFCILQDNEKMRGFDRLLVIASDIWDELRKRTLWSYSSVWLRTNAGGSFPYVELPDNLEFFLGLYQEQRDAGLVPLYQSKRGYATLSKPKNKSCGCKQDCGCICTQVENLSYSTKARVIGDTTYYEKTWTETLANGDLWEIREIPTITFKRSDEFTEEFSDEFFDAETMEVVTHTLRNYVCKIKKLPCGCVADAAQNKALLPHCCGLPSEGCVDTTMRFEDNRIYLIGTDIKPWYLLQYQENSACASTPIPSYALKAIYSGLDYMTKAFNPRVGPSEKVLSEKSFSRSKWELTAYLNPIDFEYLDNVYWGVKNLQQDKTQPHKNTYEVLEATATTPAITTTTISTPSPSPTGGGTGGGTGGECCGLTEGEVDIKITNAITNLMGVILEIAPTKALINTANLTPRRIIVASDESTGGQRTEYVHDGITIKQVVTVP